MLSDDQQRRVAEALTETSRAFLRAVGGAVEARGGHAAPWSSVRDCLRADADAPADCWKSAAFLQTLEQDGWVRLASDGLVTAGWELTENGQAIHSFLRDQAPSATPVVLRPHLLSRPSSLALEHAL